MHAFQAETEQKENLGNALTEARKALDESRQDRGALRYEVDAKNRRSEALATELHLTETTLSERQAEVVLLKQHERDYLLRIAGLEARPTILNHAAVSSRVLRIQCMSAVSSICTELWQLLLGWSHCKQKGGLLLAAYKQLAEEYHSWHRHVNCAVGQLVQESNAKLQQDEKQEGMLRWQ